MYMDIFMAGLTPYARLNVLFPGDKIPSGMASE